jgi:hypothetical protein
MPLTGRYTFQIRDTPTQRSARWESILHSRVGVHRIQARGSQLSICFSLLGVYRIWPGLRILN